MVRLLKLGTDGVAFVLTAIGEQLELLWQGDYENDPGFREHVQSRVNQLWIKKNQRISTLRAERG